MAREFKCEVRSKQGAMVFKLSGPLTEESDLSGLVKDGGDRVVIDLSEIDRVSSTGIVEWIEVIETLMARGSEVLLERCSSAMVQQFNLVADAYGRARISSVLLPYHCDRCDSEHEVSFEIDGDAKARLEEKKICPTCGGEMVFEDLPDAYLAFARRHTKD